jgi:hypothetical protein
MEKKVLFGPETAKEWSVAESKLEPSTEHVKLGKAALHWHVTVDYTAGEAKYPIGWPRFSHAIPEGPVRDWSDWDFLHMWIYTETSREALPKDPVGLGLLTPDKAGAYSTVLSVLKKGEWVEITIPMTKIPRNNDVRSIQFHISESNYRDRDALDLHIDDLALVRYAEPTLLAFASEQSVMFADAKCVPVRLEVAGVKRAESADLSCELRRGWEVVAKASVKVERGPQRLALDLGGKTLKAGMYELAARVAGGPMEKAQVRVVESPWE